jgi:hypothetical protein
MVFFFFIFLVSVFLGWLSILDLDCFCGSVGLDHLADILAATFGYHARHSPILADSFVIADLFSDRDDKVGTDVADIGEVE